MYSHKDGVVLRKLEYNDCNTLLELKKESWWGTHATKVFNEYDQQEWFKNLNEKTLVMVGLLNEELIGFVIYSNIDWINRKLNVSGSILKNFRKMEITYPAFCAGLDFAFEMLNMHRIEGEVLDCNLGAKYLEINKIGMIIEGKRKEAIYKCGQYYDSILIRMLRREWLELPRVKSYNGVCNLNFGGPRC